MGPLLQPGSYSPRSGNFFRVFLAYLQFAQFPYFSDNTARKFLRLSYGIEQSLSEDVSYSF